MNDELKLPKTQLEAIRYFSDPENCHRFMVMMRWPNGVACPHCNSEKVGSFSGKRRVSNCKSCKKQFTVKLGTIFQDSPIGLDKWLPAVWMIVNAKNGVSSCEIARSLGVTQKTAWYMGHRIRMALESGTFHKLGGIVEVDESYIGGSARNMHQKARERRGITNKGGYSDKTGVMGLLERNSKDKSSRVVTEVLKNVDVHVASGNVRKYVLKDAELHTDKAPYYSRLKEEFIHKVVDHAECYVKDNVHTNGLENFWSLLKRTIKGTYVSIAPFHLHRYLGEQVYRFNERKGNDGERFVQAIKNAPGKHLPYLKLIGVGQKAETAT